MNKKKKITLLIVGIVLLSVIMISLSYAYFIYNKEQNEMNSFSSACFKITFEEENDISLLSSLPVKDKDVNNLTPYTFTIKNVCSIDMDYYINLEVLNNTNMDLNAIKYKLDKNDPKVLGTIEDNDSSTFINENVSSSKTIRIGTLKSNVSKTFNLRMWIDHNSSYEQASGKDFYSKIVVTTKILNPNIAILENGADFNQSIKELAGSSMSEEDLAEYNEQKAYMQDRYNSYIQYKEENYDSLSGEMKAFFDEEFNSFMNSYSLYDLSPYLTLTDKNINYIVISKELPPDGVETKIVSASDSPVEITAWFDTDTIYLYTANEILYLNNDVKYMFSNLAALKSLDLSKFDSSNVVNMSYMFGRIGTPTVMDSFALSSISGLENFDTSNVTDMSYMFCGLTNLTNINVGNFDTSNVENLSHMFEYNIGVNHVDVSSWNTSNVTNMANLFYGLTNINDLSVSNFDTSNVINMAGMFTGVANENIDLSNFDTSNVTDMSSMFASMSKLKNIDLSNFNTSKVISMSGMFGSMQNITSLDLSNFDTSSVLNMSNMFASMPLLSSLNINSFDTSKVVYMAAMFSGDTSLTSLDLSNFNTSNVTYMSDMFYKMSSLTSLDLSSFDTSNVTNMSNMFQDDNNLTSLNISSFNTSKVKSMSQMFQGLGLLGNIDVSSFDTSNVTSMFQMFSGMSSLTSLDLSNFDTSNVTTMTNMFSGDYSLTSLNVSSFYTPKVTSMFQMFYGLRNLTSLDISLFDTSSVTDMRGMFYNMRRLTTIYVGNNWSTTSVTSSDNMFTSSTLLVGGAGTTYNGSHTDKEYARVDDPTNDNPGYLTLKTT